MTALQVPTVISVLQIVQKQTSYALLWNPDRPCVFSASIL